MMEVSEVLEAPLVIVAGTIVSIILIVWASSKRNKKEEVISRREQEHVQLFRSASIHITYKNPAGVSFTHPHFLLHMSNFDLVAVFRNIQNDVISVSEEDYMKIICEMGYREMLNEII